MYTRWTKKIPKEDRHGFTMIVSGAKPLIERIVEVIDEELSRVEKERLGKEYTEAAWPYMQADSIGEERAYKNMRKMISNLIEEK